MEFNAIFFIKSGYYAKDEKMLTDFKNIQEDLKY